MHSHVYHGAHIVHNGNDWFICRERVNILLTENPCGDNGTLCWLYLLPLCEYRRHIGRKSIGKLVHTYDERFRTLGHP